jgi:hypothetical protein
MGEGGGRVMAIRLVEDYQLSPRENLISEIAATLSWLIAHEGEQFSEFGAAEAILETIEKELRLRVKDTKEAA